MADFTLGGVPIISGDVDFCRIGAWTADIYLQTDQAPDVGTTTTLALKGRLLLCTVVATSADYLQVKCRVVAGRGKLDAVLPAKDYRGYVASQIAIDCLQEAGETPGQWDALDAQCAHWTRSQGPCRGAIRRLSRLFSGGDLVVGADGELDVTQAVPPVWRVMDDGTCDSVVDSFALSDSSFVALESWGQERLVHLSVDDALIKPGQSIVAFDATRAIDRVVYKIQSDSFEGYVFYY